MYLPRLEEIRSFCGAPVLRPLRLEKNPTIQEGSYHQPLTIDNRPLTIDNQDACTPVLSDFALLFRGKHSIMVKSG